MSQCSAASRSDRFQDGQNALVLPGQAARVSAAGHSGLSLSGSGVGPVKQGTPRPAPFEQIRVPKGGLAMPAGSTDGKLVHALGAIDLAHNNCSRRCRPRQERRPHHRSARRRDAGFRERRQTDLRMARSLRLPIEATRQNKLCGATTRFRQAMARQKALARPATAMQPRPVAATPAATATVTQTDLQMALPTALAT